MTEIIEILNNINENDDNTNKPEQKRRGRPRKEAVHTTSSEEEVIPPKKVGRPKAEWRHRPDGKYYSCAKDPEYAKKYWNEHLRKPWTCPVCDKTLQTCGPAIFKHKNSLHCQIVKLKKQVQNIPPN